MKIIKEKNIHIKLLLGKILEIYTLWTHFKWKIGSDGDFGAEMKVSMGVADSKHGVSRSQSLGFHPTAVVLAWSQPL